MAENKPQPDGSFPDPDPHHDSAARADQLAAARVPAARLLGPAAWSVGLQQRLPMRCCRVGGHRVVSQRVGVIDIRIVFSSEVACPQPALGARGVKPNPPRCEITRPVVLNRVGPGASLVSGEPHCAAFLSSVLVRGTSIALLIGVAPTRGQRS